MLVRHTIQLQEFTTREEASLRSRIDGLTWTAIGFLALVAVLTFLSHDYSGATTAVFLAFVLVFLAARRCED